jgi:hypothetical protein
VSEAAPDFLDEQAAQLEWLHPAHRAAPADALMRIRWLCAQHPDLFGAMFVVLATHQGVPRDILAAAVRQFRRDTDSLTQADVSGLFTALLTGGRQGFDTVLRTRRSGDRKPAAPSWVKD